MEETVVSKFSISMYIKVIGFAVAIIVIIGIVIHNDDLVDEGSLGGEVITALLCLALLGFALWSFVRTYIRLTISPDNIIIDYPLFIRQRIISYDDIASANTYRASSQSTSANSISRGQSFVITYNNGKTISSYDPDFDNYSDIKAAIYKYRYGVE